MSPTFGLLIVEFIYLFFITQFTVFCMNLFIYLLFIYYFWKSIASFANLKEQFTQMKPCQQLLILMLFQTCLKYIYIGNWRFKKDTKVSASLRFRRSMFESQLPSPSLSPTSLPVYILSYPIIKAKTYL